MWNDTLDFVVSENAGNVKTTVASLTKMMTALLTLEHRQLDEIVEITPEMLQGLEEFAIIGLESGQKLSIEELLMATMLPSAGDAAQALAISTAGSIADFAEMMNARAAEIGMNDTHFSNPVGMDAENYSTPADMAKLVEVAVQNEDFRRIFETFAADLPSLGRTVEKTFVPTDLIDGGKTGFTNAAGRCLASTAEIEGARYILVTIGAEDGQHVADAEKIYEWVETEYEPLEIVKAGEWLVRLPVRESETQELELMADETVAVALKNGMRREDLRYIYEGVDEITRTTEKGAKLGEWKVYQDEQLIYTQDLYYNQEMEFFAQGELVGGAVVSVLLLLIAAVGAWQGWRRKPGLKIARVIAGVALGGLMVSLVVNWHLWQKWHGNEKTVEVHELRTEEPVRDEGDSQNDHDAKSEPNTKKDDQSDQKQGEDGADNSSVQTGNCTAKYGNLMLINPNFTVDLDFIAGRQSQLISVSQTYGIPEYHVAGNGDNLMNAEAAQHLREMVAAYQENYPGHEMGTYSCFRARGTQCGRLCAATGTSDHHTGLTCDLIDLAYGSELNTDDFANHVEWQWLKENSYKYGFIDRFPEMWAGGLMSEPLNVDANGSTGLFETWHYRYVGVEAATEIATGKYNNGAYDSLEHYLKATGRVVDLQGGKCE